MSQKTKEMAKYIVMGVNYYGTGKEQRSFVENVLDRYGVEKELSHENGIVMGKSGNENDTHEEESELEEER